MTDEINCDLYTKTFVVMFVVIFIFGLSVGLLWNQLREPIWGNDYDKGFADGQESVECGLDLRNEAGLRCEYVYSTNLLDINDTFYVYYGDSGGYPKVCGWHGNCWEEIK